MTVADPGAHTSAVVALLQAAGVVTGDAGPPTVRYGWQGRPGVAPFISYATVYLLDQGFDGSLGCPDTDSDLRWQVTCVGNTRAACDAVRNAVNQALIGSSLTVAGRSVPRVRSDGGAGTRRDEAVTPPVFISTPHYAAMST